MSTLLLISHAISEYQERYLISMLALSYLRLQHALWKTECEPQWVNCKQGVHTPFPSDPFQMRKWYCTVYLSIGYFTTWVKFPVCWVIRSGNNRAKIYYFSGVPLAAPNISLYLPFFIRWYKNQGDIVVHMNGCACFSHIHFFK